MMWSAAACCRFPSLLALALLTACQSTMPGLADVPEGRELQGYGRLTDNLIFIAYEGDGEGGASTILAVHDAAARTTRVICELGGTGESVFAVRGSRVAYNGPRGIFLIDSPQDVKTCAEWEQRSRLLLRCGSCYEVAWRDDATLTYRSPEGLRTIDAD